MKKERDSKGRLKRIHEDARLKIMTMAEKSMDSLQKTYNELNTKAFEIDQLQKNLTDTCNKVKSDQAKLDVEKAQCQEKRSELDILLQRVVTSSDHDKARIEKLENDVISLQEQLENEKREQTRLRYVETGKQRESMVQLKLQLEEDKLSSNNAIREELTKQINILQKDNTIMSEEIVKIRTTFNGERDLFEKERQSLNEAMYSLKDELMQTKKSLSTTEEKIKKMTERHADEIAQQVALQQKNRSKMMAMEEEQRKQLDDLMKDIEKQGLALEAKSKEYANKEHILVQERQGLQDQFQNLKDKIEENNIKRDQLEEKVC